MSTYLRSYWKYIASLISVLAVLAFITYSFTSPNGMFSGLSDDLSQLEPDQEFAYTDLDGNVVTLIQFKGKPLVINAWASWIPFSQTELPLLSRLQEEYSDEIIILAINRKEDVGTIRAFMNTFGTPTNIRYLIDPTDHFYSAIGGYAMPETVFYNRDGVLIEHFRGVLTEGAMRESLKRILE